MAKKTKKATEPKALEPFEPIKLFGAELDIQTPDDLPAFVYLAAQETFEKLGELPNFVLATMLGAALTHHPKVARTIQNYEEAKKLPPEEQTEIIVAGSTLLNVFSRRMQERAAEAAATVEDEGDTPNDSAPESGEPTSSEEPTPA